MPPASRPRVTRWSTYFVGPYKEFRKLSPDIFKKAIKGKRGFPLGDPLWVKVVIYRTKGKYSKRDYPQGDVDNYAKSILDSGNEILWTDDDVVLKLTVEKHWTSGKPYCEIYIKKAPK